VEGFCIVSYDLFSLVVMFLSKDFSEKSRALTFKAGELGSNLLRHTCTCLPNYTALHPRRTKPFIFITVKPFACMWIKPHSTIIWRLCKQNILHQTKYCFVKKKWLLTSSLCWSICTHKSWKEDSTSSVTFVFYPALIQIVVFRVHEVHSSHNKTKKADWIAHILHRNCLLSHIIEGKIIVIRRRGRRCKQLLDDLMEARRWWRLKKEAQDRTLWRTQFERGYRPVARQTITWIWTFLDTGHTHLKDNTTQIITVVHYGGVTQ
jgi:hypothetical protein